MPIKIINEQINYVNYPNVDKAHNANKGDQLTIRNLDGNAIKLIHLLIKHGIINNINPKVYAELVTIIQTPTTELTSHNIYMFNQILDLIHINNAVTIRILCGESATGTGNDLFIFKLLEKLVENKTPVEILLSKNNIEYIESTETKAKFQSTMRDYSHAGSMKNLQKLIDKGLEPQINVDAIMNDSYKPMLKAISYSINKEQTEITLYSNEKINLNTIKQLAAKLEVPYEDNNLIELARTIEAINSKFQQHVSAGTVHDLYDRKILSASYYNIVILQPTDLNIHPFEQLLCNGQDKTIEDYDSNTNTPTSYKLNFVNTFVDTYDASHSKEKTRTTAHTIIYSHEEKLGRELFEQLDTMKAKAKSLLQHGHHTTGNCVETLWTTIYSEAEKYINKTIDKTTFSENCAKAMDEARRSLSAHHSTKQIASNIGLAVAGLGIGYIVAGQWNKKKTGSFMFFEQGLSKKLTGLENAVNHLSTDKKEESSESSRTSKP